jgi:Rha family phage regulatory protein
MKPNPILERKFLIMKEVIISKHNGILTVSSRQVAEDFTKLHKNVLDKIESLVKEIQPAENSARYFIPSNYVDLKGESRKCYELTRDGFSLLVMGFTGKKALEWKLKYIEAFNLMEQKLRSQTQDSYTIEDPIARAKRWIEEQQEKLELKATIQEQVKITIIY